jgi:hypothetical protein
LSVALTSTPAVLYVLVLAVLQVKSMPVSLLSTVSIPFQGVYVTFLLCPGAAALLRSTRY